MRRGTKIRFFARAAIVSLGLLRGQQSAPGPVPISIVVSPTENEARQILQKLNAGEDFSALAKTSSIDPSASDGGYLGLLDPASLRPELKAAAVALLPGQLSGIVRISSGYAILKLLKADPNRRAPDGAAALQGVSSAGAVRLTYDYAGFAAALRATADYEKPTGWDRDMAAACKARTEAIPAVMEKVEPLLTRPGIAPAMLRDANSLLSDLHAYRGDFPEAIAYSEAGYQIALKQSPERAPQFEEAIGLEHLQRAGLALYGKFVFPRALHAKLTEQQVSDLRQAREYFLRYLARVPEDGEVRWLLNLTFMLSGGYPAEVPKQFLIDPVTLQSQPSPVKFTDIAAAAGLDRNGQAGGLVVDDFDNDGLPDLMISNVNDCEPLAFFHNNGDGTFTDRARQAGLAGQTGGLNIIQTDYNNDGCLDLLVLRGGWENPVS